MSRNSNRRAPTAAKTRQVSGATPLECFRAYLSERNLRLTAQRRVILEEVFRRLDHFDVEEMYDSLHAAGQDISRATIYRVLPHMRHCGLIREVLRWQGRARYEPVYGLAHHDHMMCIRCGKVIEFCDKRIEDVQRLVCRLHGFRPLEHRLGIRGLCRDCLKQQRERSGGQQ